LSVRGRHERRGLSLVLAAVLMLLAAGPADADTRALLGRPILDVRVELAGAPYTDAAVLQLFETRVGEPFSMERVRESIDHLVGLGRFEDVQVFAERVEAPPGVRIRWALVPVQRITAIHFDGRSPLPEDEVRSAIAERLGAQPTASRLAELTKLVTSLYAGRGFRRARVEARLLAGRTAEALTLQLLIDAGPRSIVRAVSVTTDDGPMRADAAERLRLARGAPFDAAALDQRVAALEEQLRGLGYYEADVQATPTFQDEQATVDVSVSVSHGRRVRVVFAGDQLPENRRDALVPVRQERSVDLDLLEDASRNIEVFLRQQGYRAAEVSYVREDRGGELVITFTVRRGPLYRLRSLDVAGNEQVLHGELAPLLVLKGGEPYVDARVAAVASAVAELYRVRGFARATVKPDLVVRRDGSDSGDVLVDVRLVVTEGPQTVVDSVTVTGASELGEARLLPLLGLAAGRPYYRPQLDADGEAIERAYRNEGFPQARVEARTTLREGDTRVDVQWVIAEGPRVLVDRVLVTGNLRTSADVIRREIVLQPGAPLGDDAVVESQRRLAALGLFRRVRIVELPHGASPTRDVLIDVEEAPPTTIGYGGGLEAGRRLRSGEAAQAEERIDVAPRGFFEIGRRNLWGKNRSVTFFTRVSLRPRDPTDDAGIAEEEGGYGFNEYRVVGTFREPRPFDRQGEFQLTGFLEQAIRSSFNFRRRGVRMEYGRRIGALGISGRYSLDRTRLFDTRILPQDELNIDRLFPQVRLSMLTGSLLRDTRDDAVDPSRGALLGTDASFALRAIGSQVGFAKSFTQAFAYRKLPGNAPLTLVTGARLGVAAGFARQVADGSVVDDVPASERFFAGGDSTVRGFVLDRLGTRDTLNELGFPTGGAGMVVLNAEVRSAYWKGLSVVGFTDVGNVFRRAGDLSLADLRSAAGAGFRYRSPLGPLRFDVGFNLDPRTLPTGERERRTVFHLSLGQAF
jgi:outer membrane protein insertion porin family